MMTCCPYLKHHCGDNGAECFHAYSSHTKEDGLDSIFVLGVFQCCANNIYAASPMIKGDFVMV